MWTSSADVSFGAPESYYIKYIYTVVKKYSVTMVYNYFSSKDSKLMWNSNLEALKSYIANKLKLSGKWTSSGRTRE